MARSYIPRFRLLGVRRSALFPHAVIARYQYGRLVKECYIDTRYAPDQKKAAVAQMLSRMKHAHKIGRDGFTPLETGYAFHGRKALKHPYAGAPALDRTV